MLGVTRRQRHARRADRAWRSVYLREMIMRQRASPVDNRFLLVHIMNMLRSEAVVGFSDNEHQKGDQDVRSICD